MAFCLGLIISSPKMQVLECAYKQQRSYIMQKVITFLLCIAMLMCIAPVSVFAQQTTDAPEKESSVFPDVGNVEDMISPSEGKIVFRANPTNLYYIEEAHILLGIPSYVDVTPTKGRSLRVWILVKEGTVNMNVSQRGSVIFSKNYSTGDVDDEVVASCNGGTYRLEFNSISSANAYNPISILVYETGG